MSRKFTDNEVRAFSKNRNEERLLRFRLSKLKEEFGICHDLSSKQRVNILEECKEIKKTTGANYHLNEEDDENEEDDFDISKRVVRPWAYSVMETTYNTTYKDAVAPLPKNRKRRKRCKSETASNSQRTVTTDRDGSFKSLDGSTKSENILRSVLKKTSVYSHHDLQPREPYTRSRSQPEMKNSAREVSDNDAPVSERSKGSMFSDDMSKIQIQSVDGETEDADQSVAEDCSVNTKDNSEDGTAKEDEDEEPSKLSVSFKILSNPKYNTRILTLPRAYEIDSKSYQQEERERAISRSRSRVSFSPSTVQVNQLKSDHNKTKSDQKHTMKQKQDQNQNKRANSESEKENSNVNYATENQEKTDKRGEFAKQLHTSSKENLTKDTTETVLYKGRTLNNYIRPEERYKLDPIILKRRQNRMDKLAKESITFLKRVNHENIRVEIAFPRPARKRLLTQLVNENNAGKGRRHSNDDGSKIQQKINQFMTSITDYIYHQQVEANAEW